MGANFYTHWIPVTSITYVRFTVDDLYDVSWTFLLAGPAAYTNVVVDFNLIGHADRVGWAIFKTNVVGLNPDPGFGRDVHSFMHGRTCLCTKLATDAFFF